MWRVIGVVERMGQTLGLASEMLDAVVQTIDTEMARIQVTLDAEAAHLQRVITDLDLGDGARDELVTCVRRIEAAARHIATFAHRPADADEQIDRLLRDDAHREGTKD